MIAGATLFPPLSIGPGKGLTDDQQSSSVDLLYLVTRLNFCIRRSSHNEIPHIGILHRYLQIRKIKSVQNWKLKFWFELGWHLWFQNNFWYLPKNILNYRIALKSQLGLDYLLCFYIKFWELSWSTFRLCEWKLVGTTM